MKRFIALLLCFTFIFLTVGCGKDEPASSVNSTTTTTTEASAENTSAETTTESQKSTTVTTTAKRSETTTKTHVDISIKGVKKAEYSTPSAKQIVFYPDNLDKINYTYPVVAWANGTMCPPELYENLLKEIAMGGYIVIACDETMSADGVAQIASIDFILDKNNDANDIFYKKINSSQIAVAGHSQGGRSSVVAGVKDSRIDCVVSLAGSNFDYEVKGLKKPTFFIAGENDVIVNPTQWIVPAYNIAEGPTVYAMLKGAVHTTCCSDPAKYSGYIIKWLDGWLKNDSSALNTFKNGGALSKDSAWTDFKCKEI